MKKTILYMAAAMSMGSALLASCGSNDELTAGNSDLGKYNVTAVGSLGAETRIAFSDADKTGSITTSWEANEQLLVFLDGNAVTLNATTVNDKTATFTGQATTAPTSSSNWTAVTGTHAKIDGTKIICDYVGQDGSLASAQKYDYIYTISTSIQPIFEFSLGRKLSYILRMTLPAGVTAVELNAPKWSVFSNALGISGPSATLKSLSLTTDEIQTITFATATTDGDNVRYFAVPAVDYSNGLRFTFFKGESLSAGKVAFVNLSDGKVGNIDFSSALSFVKRPTEYVDLGLSVKWASYNIGATKAEEYGNYYAWGETNTKLEFLPNTSRFYGSKILGLQGANIINDDENLNPSYDVATINWGRKWRMPTYEEMEELSTKCTWTHTTLNGVSGYLIVGPNTKSIFLPAAGSRYDSNLNDDSRGYYWSSRAYDNDKYAFFLFNSELGPAFRYYGYSVRPVTDN